mmetsp:Transcript_14266/g.35420  ORF Transcript_14266/g.35420 Transcript_14266/m.35420 type:complete len:173 (-) Transcript_14266:534-1052(-)|eukprot:g5936.t1
MDVITLQTIRRSIEKENRLNRKWADEAALREEIAAKRAASEGPQLPAAPSPDHPVRKLKRVSSAEHYLTQKMGLKQNPFDAMVRNQAGSFTPEQLLYFGVSAEGEGRSAYLRKRRGIDWQDKSRFTIGESQEVGWTLRSFHGTPSAYARRPIVMAEFFRTNGIPLKMERKKE